MLVNVRVLGFIDGNDPLGKLIDDAGSCTGSQRV